MRDMFRGAIRSFQHRLREAWFPIVMSAFMFGMFSTFGLAAGQVQEVLVSYVGANSSFDWLRASVTLLAILIFALTLRHWTARLLGLDIHSASTERWTGWRKIFMLTAWYAPWLGGALSFAQAHTALGGELNFDRADGLFATSFGALAATSAVLPAILVVLWWLPPVAAFRERAFQAPLVRWGSSAVLPAIFIMLAGYFLLMPPSAIEFARTIGPVPIVCISLSLLTALGSYLIAWSRKHSLPAFTCLALAPVVIGALGWDDNHFIRRLSPPREIERTSLDEALSEFARADRRAPIVLITTEGGGIRAAHFTAMVLGRLADQCPRLARRVFAINAVSGGAVGAAAFRASLEALPLEGDTCDLAADRAAGPRERALSDMLSRDHLSPVLAKMAFPEIVQTFLPASSPETDSAFFPETDRQLGLELSFEQAFADAFGVREGAVSPFENSVFSFAAPPYLIINMTLVSSGGDYAVSSLDLSGVREQHPWLRDFRCLWGDHTAAGAQPCSNAPDFRLSTMAVSSARFPFISPAGTARRTEQAAYRFVDGGYFDNSGIEATMAIVDHLRARPDFESNILPRLVILHIDSNPYPAEATGPAAPSPRRLDLDIHELQAVLATREERVRMSFNKLDNLSDEGSICDVVLVEMDQAADVSLRLGWILSNAAASELRRQAAQQLERGRNQGNLSLGGCRRPRAPPADTA